VTEPDLSDKHEVVKTRVRTISLGFFTVATSLFMSACAVDEIDQSRAIEELSKTSPLKTDTTTIDYEAVPQNFAIESRPTKTLNTPWGEREVYDPAQDQEVLAAIEKIYKRGDVFFGDVHKVSPRGPVKADSLYSVRLVRHARRIQDLDMARAGCRVIQSVPCQAWTSIIIETPCPDPNFGSPNLSACESVNKLHREDMVGLAQFRP